ncbi:hypothetical protein OKW98_26085 [Pseudomonas sp. KU26590]|uniref:hypothetical protein n=1 Tax=Pseudomonas sp. KU26590 TaxID=2991051 RepID=UPI00223E52A7|nr:hypothetical protein [Pseudomonas sp. KU26590]UZJ59950.1 hypothetical protein OKW98_26085 [Pseudomonas sp. KU26590]
MRTTEVLSTSKPRKGTFAEDPTLLPAVIPNILTANKIKVTEADSGLRVDVPAWPGITAGHNIYVTIGGNLSANRVTPAHVITAAEAADPKTIFSFTLNSSYTLAEGPLLVSFMDTTRTGSNPRWPVTPVTVVVDRTPPGGDLLPLLLDANGSELSGTLLESDLVADEFITAVSDYDGTALNDIIEPFIIAEGTVPPVYLSGSIEIVDADEVHTRKVLLHFKKADIVALGDGLHKFGYRVTDEPGNVSKDSPVANIRVILSDVPSALDAPIVPAYKDSTGAGDGVVNDDDARAQVEVEVPTYTTPKVNDIITVHWGSQIATGYSLTLADITSDPVTTILLSFALVSAEGSATEVPVYYTVTRGGREFPKSPTTLVNVDLTVPGGPDPATLLRPTIIVGFSGGPVNEIPNDDFGMNATATIPYQTNDVPAKNAFLSGDVVTIIWGGVEVSPGYTVGTADVGRNLRLTVPGSYINTSGSIPVSYIIRRELLPPYSPPQYGTGKAPDTLVDVRSDIGLPNDGKPFNGPTFPRVNADGVIDQENGRLGGIIRCPVDITNVTADDSITLTFIGLNFDDDTIVIPGTEYTHTDTLTSADITQKYYEFTVPVPTLRKVCVGYGRASYALENDKGTGSSDFSKVTIDLSDASDGTCATDWP